jgi:hypothetical protein
VVGHSSVFGSDHRLFEVSTLTLDFRAKHVLAVIQQQSQKGTEWIVATNTIGLNCSYCATTARHLVADDLQPAIRIGVLCVCPG